MRKLSVFLCVAVFVFGAVGVASALPFVDHFGYRSINGIGIEMQEGEVFTQNFDLDTDALIVGHLQEWHSIDRALLLIGIYGNDNDTESNFCTGLFNRWITGAEEEYARLRTDGGPEIGGEVDGQLYGVDVTSELNDHMLTLTITADEGSNFWITGTTLAGSYDNGGVVPVPEPATMFLMGIGLLAIGNVGIRIKKS